MLCLISFSLYVLQPTNGTESRTENPTATPPSSRSVPFVLTSQPPLSVSLNHPLAEQRSSRHPQLADDIRLVCSFLYARTHSCTNKIISHPLDELHHDLRCAFLHRRGLKPLGLRGYTRSLLLLPVASARAVLRERASARCTLSASPPSSAFVTSSSPHIHSTLPDESDVLVREPLIPAFLAEKEFLGDPRLRQDLLHLLFPACDSYELQRERGPVDGTGAPEGVACLPVLRRREVRLGLGRRSRSSKSRIFRAAYQNTEQN